MEIITSRPEGMDYRTYRKQRKNNQQAIREYLKGTVNRIESTQHFTRQGKLVKRY